MLVRALRLLFESLRPDPPLAKLHAQVTELSERLRVELGQAVASRHLVHKRLTDMEQRLAERAQAVEAALHSSEADARLQVGHQLDEEAERTALDRALHEARAHEAELEQRLTALLRTKEELRRELAGELPPEGDSSPPSAGDALDSAAREKRIRDRLRELRARRGD